MLDLIIWNVTYNNLNIQNFPKEHIRRHLPIFPTYCRPLLGCVARSPASTPVWWRSPTTWPAPAPPRSPRTSRWSPPVLRRSGPPLGRRPCYWRWTRTRVGYVSRRYSEATSTAPSGWCRSAGCPGVARKKINYVRFPPSCLYVSKETQCKSFRPMEKHISEIYFPHL